MEKNILVGLVFVAAFAAVLNDERLAKLLASFTASPRGSGANSSTSQSADHAQKAWDEIAAKHDEQTRKQLEKFEHDGFFKPEVEAAFDDMAKESKPTYMQTGFGEVKK